MAARGRKPGSLVRAKCGCCGAVEPARGAANYRCRACRLAGLRVYHRRHDYFLGKDDAGSAVSSAIRSGLLPSPRGLVCADCSGPAVEYDHRDYNKPTEVAPVCRSCNLKRGPAIPVHGSIPRVVARGAVPYRLRLRAEQMLRVMGLPVDALADMPAKLTLDHWRELLPLFAAKA